MNTRRSIEKKTRDTRGALLIAAARLFAERGYAGTHIRDVCEAAGVTRPTLYHRFGSKAGLAAVLFNNATARFIDAIQRVTEEDGTPHAKLKAVATIVFEWTCRAPHFTRLVYASLFLPAQADPGPVFDRLLATLIETVAGLFAEAAEARPGAGSDPDLSAMMLLGALHAYTLRFVRHADVHLTPELAARIVDRVLIAEARDVGRPRDGGRDEGEHACAGDGNSLDG